MAPNATGPIGRWDVKRAFDVTIAAASLILLSPIIGVAAAAVWLHDRKNPFYIAPRVTLGGRRFGMVKIRSMVVGADNSGVEATGAHDMRITRVGHFIRRWKIDEIAQLWNVLGGDMSLVGPRPNTVRCVEDYRADEFELLNVRPGMTDFASIVFSDEGDIIANAADPTAEYFRLIWPWKRDLGLLYVRKHNVLLDIQIVWLTVLAIANKRAALRHLGSILTAIGAPSDLCTVAQRDRDLSSFAAG